MNLDLTSKLFTRLFRAVMFSLDAESNGLQIELVIDIVKFTKRLLDELKT